MRDKIDTQTMFVAGICTLIVVHALDIISTVLCMAYVPGSIELNALMRDPNTLKFALIPALQLKGLHILVCQIPLAIALFIGSRSWGLASLPFWLNVPSGLETVIKNIAMLLFLGVYR